MARSFARNFVDWFLGRDEGEDVGDDAELRYQSRTYGAHASAPPEPEPAEEERTPRRGGGWFNQKPSAPTGDVVEMRAGRPTTTVLYPRSFDDAQELADLFKQGTFLILDLEKVDEKDRGRLVHFLCGVSYGCDGKSHRINELTFAFAPRSYSLQTDDRTAPGERPSYDIPKFGFGG